MNLPQYPRYESYKDVGEGWIGEVPDHWDDRKLKHLFREKKHRANMGLNCGAISFGEVVEKDDERIPLSTKASYQEVLTGEFLVNPLNLNYDLKSLRIGLSEIDVVVSAGYIVLQATSELDKRYYKYLLHRYDVANMKLLGSGVRQTISFNHISNSVLVAPPLAEQQAIARFLDEKTNQIDRAVKIKERQIALLRERKQIIIQAAVTKGLNPDVPMKDSGISWIGHVPAHWDILPFTKYCASQVDYRGKTPEKVEDGVLLVTAKNVRDGFLDYEVSREYIAPSNYEKVMSRGRPQKGDILFTTEAPLGKVAVVDDESVALAQRIIKFRLKPKLKSEYINFFLNSWGFQGNLVTMSTGSTALGIKASKLHKLVVAAPPSGEQLDIIEYLNDVSFRISETIELKERQILTLEEYKTSLIDAAVTGKIKVT